MANFDIIETFNTAEETQNFGTRCVADGNNLYEVVTLSTLSRSIKEEKEHFPEIHACFKNEILFLSLDNRLQIFGNCQSLDVLFKADFDAIIDALSVSEQYLLICLRNGSIHFMDITTVNLLFDKSVGGITFKDDPYFIESFVEVEDVQSGMVRYILVNKLGLVTRVTITVNNAKVDDVQKFECAIETIVDFNRVVTLAVMTNDVLLLNGANLWVCDINDPEYKRSLDSLCLKKAYADGQNNFIGLLEDGRLITICAITFFVTYVQGETLFEELVFYSGGEDVCFGTVIESDIDGFDRRYIRLLNYPSFTEIFSLEIVHDAYLAYSHNIHDEQIFISLVNYDELRLQMITEAVPEKRLERLLKKQKFDEAEKFALIYNLDVALIHMAKARNLADAPTCDADDIEELIGLLKNIKNLVFVLKCCLDVSSDDVECIHRVLSFGCTLQPSKECDEDPCDYICSINAAMFKLETYKIILKYKNMQFDYISWSDFNQCNPYDYLYANLRPNNMEASIFLYARLRYIREGMLSEDNIKSILNILDRLQMVVYMPFLPTFISNTLECQPTTLPIIVQWIYDCVHTIETYNYANFPENAIGFLKKMLHLLELNSATIQFERHSINSNELLTKLYTLSKALETINTFKNNFMVFVPLKDCLKGPVALVNALLFLESIEVDDSLIKFLSNYLIENQFHPDDVYYNVIMELMTYEDKYWMSMIMAIWKGIHSAETKLKALLEVLDALETWSDTLKDMCKMALELKHSLVKLVEIEMEREPIYIVLRRKPYKLMNENIDTVLRDSDMFPIKRIIYCNQPTMQEDVYTLCLTPIKKKRATELLFDNYIMKGEESKALLLLYQQSPEDLCRMYDLFIKNVSFTRKEFCDDKRKESYMKFASYLLLRDDPTDSTNFDKNTLRALINCDVINKQYGTDFTYTDIITDAQKETVLDNVLSIAIKRSKITKRNYTDIIKDAIKLSSMLDVEEYKVLLKLCEMYKDINVYYHAIEYAYEYSTHAETLCVLAMFILKSLGSSKIQLNGGDSADESSLDVSDHEVAVSSDLIKQCLVYARKAGVKALSISDSEFYDVYNWVNCTFISDEVSAGKSGLFQNIYETKSTMLSTNSVDTVRDIFVIYLGYIAKHNVHSKPISYFLRNTEFLSREQLICQVNTWVPVLLQNLCSDGNTFAACNLIMCLKNALVFHGERNEQIHTKLNSLLLDCNSKLLKKVFAFRRIDETLLLNLLLFYTYQKAANLLKQGMSLYQRELDKFESIARVGMRYSYLNNAADGTALYDKLLLLTKWWKNINTCVLPFKEFIYLSRDQLLSKLIEQNSVHMLQIQSYCTDFKIDIKNYYSTYLETQLLSWKLVYTVGVDDVGKRCLKIENDGLQLYEECMKIVDNISDKDGVYNLLSDISLKINLYHYEVFICILSIMGVLKPEKNDKMDTQLQLLKFLQGYTRYSKPSDTETEEWYKMFPDSQKIDALSEWRIPFTTTLFNERIWDILKTEMNLNSYKQWLEAEPILNKYFTVTDICCYAIKSLIASGIWQNKQQAEWILHSKHSDLIEEIDLCLQHIPDVDQAASAAYFFLKYVPPGADLVTAAKLCLEYALKYKDAQLPGKHERLAVTSYSNIKLSSSFKSSGDYTSSSNSSLYVLNKPILTGCQKDRYRQLTSDNWQLTSAIIHSKYYSYATKHILYTNYLATPEYLEMVGHPVELIELLYADARIAKHNLLNCPDINGAADQISELHKLNIMDIRLSIIENLLLNDLSTNINLEESICINVIGNNYNDSENNYEKRISYICTSGDIKDWQKYLYRTGMQDNANYSYKAKALKCFCAISTTDEIIEITKYSLSEFLYFVDHMFLIHDMQCLGIQVDQESLSKLNKDDLIKQLARNIGNTLSVKVMSTICILYDIHNLKYWEIIITNMIKFNMFSDIKTSIDFLRKENVLYKPFYIQAWQAIIDNAFKALGNDLGDELEMLCIDNMHTIQSCPVLYQLDLKAVFKICLHLKRVGMAALLLQYFSEKIQTDFAKELLQKADKQQLRDGLEALAARGFVGTQYVTSIIQRM